MLEAIDHVRISMAITAQVVLPGAYNPAGPESESRTLYVTSDQVFSQIGAESEPAPSAIVACEITVGGSGSEVLDLDAAPVLGALDGASLPSATESLAGHAPLACELTTPDGNDGNVTVSPASVDGYPLFGEDGAIAIPPGAKVLFYWKGGDMPEVTETARQIQIAASQGDAVAIKMVFCEVDSV